MIRPEPDIEGARKAMNDLLGYLDWVEATPAEVSMVCPNCEWEITDDIPDRACSLCGTSMVYDLPETTP